MWRNEMTTRKKKRQDGSGSGGGFIKKVSSLFNLDSVNEMLFT